MLFGTDGIRKIAGDKLRTNLVFKIGKSLAIFFGKNKKCLVGFDSRISSHAFCASLCAGLCSCGIETTCIGVCSTPCLSFLTKEKRFDFGVMITASHNPFEYNGIKVFNSLGEKIGENDQIELEKIITSKKIDLIKDEFSKCNFKPSLVNCYVDFLAKNFCTTFNDKIIIDCANGGASNIAKKLCKKLQLNAKIICSGKNGKTINKNCGATNVEKLKTEVLKNNACFGFALDGDGDRLAVVDAFGNQIDGDALMFLFATSLPNINKIVVTEVSNFGLDNSLKKLNIDVLRTKVGDKNVYSKMKQNSVYFGGERSGHIIFLPNACSDGLFNMLKILNIFKNGTKIFYEKLALYKPFCLIERNYKMPNDVLNCILKDVNFNNLIFNIDADLVQTGRILVRKSGTENVLRILIETFEEKEAKDIEKEISHFIKNYVDSTNKKQP